MTDRDDLITASRNADMRKRQTVARARHAAPWVKAHTVFDADPANRTYGIGMHTA